MIKHINHQNVTTTPFVAAKARVLSNVQNSDAVILEGDSGSVAIPDTYVALDYIDYNSGNPIINRDCDIALEQQDIDALGYEEGITGSGVFNPNTDAQNEDGTFKSLVHRSTKNAFYNTYRNPTEIFGVEHIDFPLSKTLRNLSDHFRMFTIPQLTFGDKIQPKSVQFYDTLFDDNVAIFDDGYQNLVAGYNLFSKVQEVRTTPAMPMTILPGSMSIECITYDNKRILASASDSMSLYLGQPLGSGYGPSGSFHGGNLEEVPINQSSSLAVAFNSGSTWNAPPLPDFPLLQMGFQYGSIDNYVATEYALNLASIGFSGGGLLDVIVSSSISESVATITSTFLSGSIFDVIVWVTGSNDSHSLTNVTFLSGSLFDVIVWSTGSHDSHSLTNVTFLSGNLFLVSIVTPLMTEAKGSYTIGFNSGFISP